MPIRQDRSIKPSEITPQNLLEGRREFLRLAAGAAAGLALPAIAADKPSDTPTPLRHVTGYNNFYEFGTSKEDPAARAHLLKTRPWAVSIEGLVRQPRTLALDDILRLAPQEERIYRLRCVEGWSMVIPWLGIPLSALLKQVEPLGSAKYVELVSVLQPENMPGARSRVLDWPYVEGLPNDALDRAE